MMQYPPTIAEGGLPEGMCVHGATGTQYQLPRLVPTISRAAVAMKIQANSAHRSVRRTKYANTGRHSAPWTSRRCVVSGKTVTPASDHPPAIARIA
jgi:hypothetical protein